MAGRFALGERPSSEWELAPRYQASRLTVRCAVAVLKGASLVVMERSAGGSCAAVMRCHPNVAASRGLR